MATSLWSSSDHQQLCVPPFPLPRALELGLTVPVGDRYNSNQYIKGDVSCCKNRQKKGEVCGSKPGKHPKTSCLAGFFSGKVRGLFVNDGRSSCWRPHSTPLFGQTYRTVLPILSPNRLQTIRHVVKRLSGINNNSEKHPKFWCICIYVYIHTYNHTHVTPLHIDM